jgi:parallel beta-helix repeat protein
VDRYYEVPESGTVHFVAPDGRQESRGTRLDAPTTIEAAIERVVTGDTIVMRGGVYRTGGMEFNQGITLQPYGDERPVMKGTLVADKWQSLRGNVWRTPWKRLFPAKPLPWWSRASQGTMTPMHRFNSDMVFVDGKMLQSAGWEGELDETTFYIDYEGGFVYIGVDPTDRLVEITAYDSAFVRTAAEMHGKTNDRKGPVIRGITFTQYADRAIEIEGRRRFTINDERTDEPYGPADPATYGKEVIGTTLENVTISFCSRVGGFFRGDGLVIRNSLISDTSTEGLYIIGSSDVLLERNIVRRNNMEHFTGYFPSAIKIFNQSHRVTVRDNLILENPISSGVWYDVGNRDGVFVNNYVEDAANGFFFEISRGVTVAGNVFVRCGQGIYILNAADARIYNNTFVDATAAFDRNQRSAEGDHFGWHPATGPDVDERDGHVFMNNLMVASASFGRPLLRFGQPAVMCDRLPESQAEKITGNVYARVDLPEVPAAPLIHWSPVRADNCMVALESVEAFKALAPGFETGGRQLDKTPRSVFRGPDIGRYELLYNLPGMDSIEILPEDVRELLGWTREQAGTVGAYPLERQ